MCPAAGPGPCLRLDLAYCPKCEKTHSVAVSALSPKSDGNGHRHVRPVPQHLPRGVSMAAQNSAVILR